MSSGERFERLRRVYRAACDRAPALRERFTAAGLRVDDLREEADLNRLPVLKKEALLAQQISNPPFAGYLACDLEDIAHIYVSPGPICEPSLADDRSGHGMQMMFAAAGIGRGDLALNSWAYHLVPAGLLFDQGLRAVGATVLPAGTGNTDLQAELLLNLPVTAFLGSTAFFQTLIDRIESHGHSLPAAWSLRHAFLGGELGGWLEKRRQLEETYGIRTWSCYGTADFGLIGYEEAGQTGYRIHPDRYLQICDPATGRSLPTGQSGEIVVTTLIPGWPMIRFGTGDVSSAIEIGDDGGAARIAPLQGRVGQAVKAREIFIYPGHIEALPKRVPGIRRANVTVRRSGSRDEVVARVLLEPGVDAGDISARLREAFASLTRLHLDAIEIVFDLASFGDSTVLHDARYSPLPAPNR